MLCQFMGRRDGQTAGRDSNLRSQDLDRGLIAGVSHLPAILPVAVGAALAFRLRGEPRVAVGWCGDGASSNGIAHESMNLAGVRRLPVVFVIDNNQFAYSTPTNLNFAGESLAMRGAAYGFEGVSSTAPTRSRSIARPRAPSRRPAPAAARRWSRSSPCVWKATPCTTTRPTSRMEMLERWSEADAIARFHDWLERETRLDGRGRGRARRRARRRRRRRRDAGRGQPVARSRDAHRWRLRRLSSAARPWRRPRRAHSPTGSSGRRSRVVLRVVFRLRVVGLENVPETGPRGAGLAASLELGHHGRRRPAPPPAPPSDGQDRALPEPAHGLAAPRAPVPFPFGAGRATPRQSPPPWPSCARAACWPCSRRARATRAARRAPRSGAARLALAGHAAFVPVAVAGTDDVRLWPPRIPRFRVAYGPPIRLDDLEGAGLRTAADEATERWKAAVAELRAKIA